MDAELTTWEVSAIGLVQGVYYRAFTKQAADELEVRGWVQNMPDGSVKALLQHRDDAQLAALVSKMRQGPPASRVSGVSVTPVSSECVYQSFDILRG